MTERYRWEHTIREQAGTRALVPPAILSLFFVASCGGGELTDEDIEKGWAATSHAISSAKAASRGEETSFKCPGGGKLTQKDSFEDDDEGIMSKQEFRFDDCKNMGVVINGELMHSAAAGEKGLTQIFKGNLSWSGEVEGDCSPIDLKQTVAVGESGATATVKGSICGKSAEAIVKNGSK